MAAAFNQLAGNEVRPLLELANAKQGLDDEDLPPVQPDERCEHVLSTFNAIWDASATWTGASSPGMRFFWAILTRYKGTWLYILALRASSDVLSFASPLAMEKIIEWLADPAHARAWWEPCGLPLRLRGLYFAAVMTLGVVARSLLDTKVAQLSLKMSTQVFGWSLCQVFTKALGQKTHVRAHVSSGQVISLMQSDSWALWRVPILIPRLPRAFVKGGIGIFLLVKLMGRGAVFAGLTVMCGLAPLTGVAVTQIEKYWDKSQAKRDKRMGQLNELLSAIKLVKLNGWESGFAARIAKTREQEMKAMWMFHIFDHVFGAVTALVPVATLLTMFGVYSWLGNQLTPAVTFTGLALLDEIRQPILSVAAVCSDLVRAWSAVARLSAFFGAEQLDMHAVEHIKGLGADQPAISIKSGKFAWLQKPKMDLIGSDSEDDDEAEEEDGGEEEEETKNQQTEIPNETFRLESVDMDIPVGSLVAVIGSVGAGKSSLLSALLGEMDCEGSPVKIKGRVAYAAQSAFVLNATVKENVLFGQACENDRLGFYEKVLEACALTRDLQTMKKGDLSEVGEGGATISGGQKQRISLARAAFADSDVLLLDDCLSAVDVRCGNYLCNRSSYVLLSESHVDSGTRRCPYLETLH